MTFRAADPVASGWPYVITTVADRAPLDLDQFTGLTNFTIAAPSGQQRVGGVGTRIDAEVRFQEKDVEHDGKDVRVWRISRSLAQAFVAEPEAEF